MSPHLRARAAVLRSIREFFHAEAFLEVETPLAVPSPGLDVHIEALEVSGLGGPRWLATSPEYQMKRLLAAGHERIYQLGKCFRKGERGHLHEPEFTMLEWYRADAGAADVMDDTERLVARVVGDVCGATTLPGRAVSHGPVSRARVDVATPWERITVDEAFQRWAGVSALDVLPDEERFFRTLIEDVEPNLGRSRPVFLTRWPASMAALARLCPDDPRWADRFELYVDGIELCNGFDELTDAAEQRARLEAEQEARRAAGREVYPIDERFLAALEHGMPASGGNALGVDRLVMLVTGARHIEEVLAFPQARL